MSRFGIVRSPRFLDHETGGHVENRSRIEAILAALQDLDEVEDVSLRRATNDEILSLHGDHILAQVEAAAAEGGAWLDPDTYVSEESPEVARQALGSSIDLTRAVLAGELDRGFACVRPPGHHATPVRSMGFCLFSTIALTARACRDKAPKIFIFDWDVHHGNGTQDCLYDDGNTCFFSMHQSPFYPGTGHPDERGRGAGAGLNYNLPLPAGCGDAEYLWAYDRLVAPLMKSYAPDLVLVSAGYDAHRSDPLGGMGITTAGFAALAERVLATSYACPAQGRVVGLLEGGYHPQALAASVRATIDVWKSGQRATPEPVEAAQVDPTCVQLVEKASAAFGL